MIGIEIINNESEFKQKVLECLKYDFKVVIEKKINNLKEVNISVIGNDEYTKTSVIEEVTDGFLDFDKKYQPKGSKSSAKKIGYKSNKINASKGMASTSRRIPAKINNTQKKTIEQVATKVFKVLNVHGCVRIDFMIDNKTGKVYCNEINTIPGSLAFYLWSEVGLDFASECNELIKNALNRYAKKASKTYTFDTNILDNYTNNNEKKN